MLSISETLVIERGLKKLESDLSSAIHKSNAKDISTVYYAVLDWMEENVERIEFKTPK